MTPHPLLARPRSLDWVGSGPPWWRRLDFVLLGCTLAIALAGLLMVFSATRSGHGEEGYTGFAVRQVVWVFLGSGLMALVAGFDYRKLRGLSPWLYGGSLALLALVLTPLGSERKGTQAWFEVAGFQFQPSEYAKLALILALSAYCARLGTRTRNRFVAVAVVIAALPTALIALQPDLGTMLVFGAVALVLLVVAGAPLRALGVLAGLALAAAIAVVQLGMLQQYQLDRLGAFLDPASNTERAAYNLNQSKIAIGSGGLTGKGLFLGTQTNLRYVPEQHTDFIFTVVGEELGLIGSGSLLGFFVVLLWRIWRTARDAPDRFGTLLCSGVLAMLAFQIFQNVGMTMGIMPITGIPLPFVSYGGSAMLTCFLGLGLVLSVRFRSGT